MVETLPERRHQMLPQEYMAPWEKLLPQWLMGGEFI
jgi:hypothetical protein